MAGRRKGQAGSSRGAWWRSATGALTLLAASIGTLPATAAAARPAPAPVATHSDATLPAAPIALRHTAAHHAAARPARMRAFAAPPADESLIVASNSSAGYAWGGIATDAHVSTTFTVPSMTCPFGGAQTDFGIVTLTTYAPGQAGQASIYDQNFCAGSSPVYRLNIQSPGNSYNGYGVGVALSPGEMITLTADITSAATTVACAIGGSGSSTSCFGSGSSRSSIWTGPGSQMTSLEVGAKAAPGSSGLMKFTSTPVTFVDSTVNGTALLNFVSNRVNCVIGTTVEWQTSKFSNAGQDFTVTDAEVPGPAVSNVSPNQGPKSGGTNITITGSGFGAPGDPVEVDLFLQTDGVPVAASNVQIVDDSHITATTPDVTSFPDPGDVPAYVEVLADGAISGYSSGAVFDYLGPDPGILLVTNPEVYPHGGDTQFPFQVYLEQPRLVPVTVHWTTVDGTAHAGTDYDGASGDITFQPGDQSVVPNITVHGRYNRTTPTFQIVLSDPTNAFLDNGPATITIIDTVSLGVGDVSITRPSSGTNTATATIYTDSPAPDLITMHYATSDGSAAAGTDYTASSGTAKIAAGKSSVTVKLNALANKSAADSRNYFLTVSNVSPSYVHMLPGSHGVGSATISIGSDSLQVFTDDQQLPADGTHITTLHVVAHDPSGNPLSGAKLKVTNSFSSKPPGGKVSLAKTLTTAADGTATAPLSSTAPGMLTITAALTNPHQIGAASTTVQLLAAGITVSSDVTKVWANGHAKAHLTITVVSPDGTEAPAGTIVDLTASPSKGVKFSNPHPVVAALGEAEADVTSTTEAQGVTITAKLKSPTASGSTSIDFVRHTLIVQMLGIRTSLSCSSGTCSSPDDLYPTIRNDLIGSAGFAASDFLWYSYGGGTVQSDGTWNASSYVCGDTAESYRYAIADLSNMILHVAKSNPNTDFEIVGHSQGGLLGLQEIGFTAMLPPTDKVTRIITLDSPLGGVDPRGISYASSLTCWTGPANAQLANLFTSNTSGAPYGDQAQLLCTLVTKCSYASGTTNAMAVAQSSTQVATIGSDDDALYTPAKCGLDGLLPYAVPTSQAVSTAFQSTMFSAGGNSGDPISCISGSHSAIVGVATPSIEALLGRQT